MVIDDEYDDRYSYLTIALGQQCSGHKMATIIPAMISIMADCAVQSGIPKQLFLAQVYETLSNMYDSIIESEDQEEETNGRSSYN